MRMTTGLGVRTGLALAGEPAMPTTSGHMVGKGLVSRIRNGASQFPTNDGHIAPQTAPAPGSYLDAMTVTVTY